MSHNRTDQAQWDRNPGQHASTFTLRQATPVQAGTENSALDGEWSASRPGQCRLNRRLGGLQRCSRQFREEKTLLPLLGIEPDYALSPTNGVCAVESLPLFALSTASTEN